MLVAVLLTSCVKELELAPSMSDSELTTLVPRVKSFTNQYITKAAYTDQEKAVNSLAVLIFDNNGNLVDTQTGTSTVTINKTMLKKKEMSASTVVMFANISLNNIVNASGSPITSKTDLHIDDIADYSYSLPEGSAIITSLETGFAGFPMMGIQEGVNLTPTSTQQNAIQVDLKILYAKINFEIGVADGTENTGTGMKFQLNSYEVFDAPLSTALAQPAATVSSQYDAPEKVSASDASIATLNGTPLKFTFYVAENRYTHNANLANVYPSSEWVANPSPYDNLKQQYKPAVASASTADGNPTYVVISGKYTDYRGKEWTVDYTVYLGKDNHANFDVDRNSEYTNILTIKGIRNSDTYGNDAQSVWIDHRVHATTNSLAGNVTITRETLIDSHIEVRPLRVKWDGDTYDRVNLYLPSDENNNLIAWIGIEKFTRDNCQDGATYCFTPDGNSTGKRKYFTTGLINELQSMGGDLGIKTDANGRKYLDMYNGHCAWIYFDENTSNSQRHADIKLDFYVDNNVVASETYVITQQGLQTIGNAIIESYEEYLHSYDPVDKYNLSTSPVDYTQQGLAWGASVTISEDVIVAATPTLPGLVSQRYDYFHRNDVPAGDSYYTYTKNSSGNFALTPDATQNFGNGLIFTDRASEKQKITVMDMGTIPSNAYQYCLSKNKFREDAEDNHTLDIHWYLPDAHELNSLLQANQAYNTPADLKSDAKYWTSQPAFTGILTQNLAYLNEMPDSARAVSAEGIKNEARNIQGRIRCFYSLDGIKGVDMSDRVPDGLGGNHSILMKGKPEKGYFHYLLKDKTVTVPENIVEDFTNTEPYYPKNETTGTEFNYVSIVDKTNTTREGFKKNPANWNEYIIDLDFLGEYPTGYYTTLATYPGLTEYTTEKMGRSILDIGLDLPIIGHVSLLKAAEYLGINVDQWLAINAYKPTTTPLSQTQKLTASKYIDLREDPIPENADLRPLDDKLKISFGSANSAGNKPDFEYYELINKTESSNIRYWIPPNYTETSYPLTVQSGTYSSSGTGSANGTSIAVLGSLNSAKQDAFQGSDGALELAKRDAITKIKAKIPADMLPYFDESKVVWNPSSITWQTSSPTVTYQTITNSWTKGYEVICTVNLNASITISTPPEIKLFIQDSGTGQWSDPEPYSSTSEGPTLTSDELRIYCGNSFTITCTDPDYEITKVKVHFSGSNQIEDGVSVDYLARFVDSTINLTEPIKGDESSHLFGMEYNEADGWHQWSGSGKQSITLNLADYVITSELDWGEILSGNLGSAVAYDYEYRTASRNLNQYIVVDRIEVKCIQKASAN